jgi:hypothetical protein
VRGLLAVSFVLIVAFSATSPVAEGQVYIPLAGSGATPTIPTSTPWPTSTPTQTNIPTVTATPTQTGTPTVTPTATDVIGNGITVLSNHSTYVDWLDFLHVVGEVRNDAGVAAGSITVTVISLGEDTFYVVDTVVELDVLVTNDRTCFDVVVVQNPAWEDYEFATAYTESTSSPRPVSIFDVTGEYQSSGDYYRISGRVQNDGDEIEEDVAVVGTLYSADGKVIRCDSSGRAGSFLEPDEVVSWDVTFYHMPPGLADSYRVQAD